jgi:hypothetical protein
MRFNPRPPGEFPREAPLFGAFHDLGSVLPNPYLRKFRQAFGFRFRSRPPGFTRAAANLAAKPFPLSDAPETRSV